jgi:hypothetical protein
MKARLIKAEFYTIDPAEKNFISCDRLTIIAVAGRPRPTIEDEG